MSTPSLVQTLFGSKTRIDLLTIFISRPGEHFYIRQLAALLKQSPTPVLRELLKMENLGLVTSERKANAKYYTVNTLAPIYPELQSIILKTVGVGEVVKKHLKSLGLIKFAFVYGSFATHEADLQSDLDLFMKACQNTPCCARG